MVDVSLNVANNDIPQIREWIGETKEALIEVMIAPIPTSESNRATLMFTLLGRFDTQLADHLVKLEELLAAAKAARRKTKK